MRRQWVGAGALMLALTGGGVALSGQPEVPGHALRVPVGPDAGGHPVELDASFFPPVSGRPGPAVVLAHGWGGSKDSTAGLARQLARAGYAVLTYTARGFGRSGGQIALDSPRYEVRDAVILIDWLAARREVVRDGPGDPRVGFAGSSYGGALALLVAGTDRRVDAIVPMITWNDLRRALFAQSAVVPGADAGTPAGAVPVSAPGVFKRAWAGYFFGAAGNAAAEAGAPPARPEPTLCGRLDPALCAAYQASAPTGVPTRALLDLLARSSPASVVDRIRAPTLLVHGEVDSLFPFGEADANARAIAATGTPVQVVWFGGGHDGASLTQARTQTLVTGWFDRYLRHPGVGPAPGPGFSYDRIAAGLGMTDSAPRDQTLTAPALPGLPGAPATRREAVTLRGPGRTLVSPAGGNPAAVSNLPGLGWRVAQLGGATLGDPPGQVAAFTSDPLSRSLPLLGAATVDLRVSASGRDSTLFAKLYDLAPDGQAASLPSRLVAPVRLGGLTPGRAVGVRVALPAVVHEFPAGHRLRVVVVSTDTAYQVPVTARTYRVALADGDTGTVSMPLLAGTAPAGGRWPLAAGAAGAMVVLLVAAAGVGLRRRRRAGTPGLARGSALAGVPVRVRGLGKSYRGGLRVVSDLSFRVEAGQVLGLLGPNGAGKTTTLRMLIGLIHPSEGELRLFGHPVTPGAPVLSRVGAFVEGPGFLPHLSGRENLRLYWAVTGRPAAEAHVELTVELAGLGSDLDRPVRTYSHGMRQRLGVAQAMLGLPELLVLDEPTNGLDPPQIREMRAALTAYAGTGRTVVVSSHLLTEVEQTCTHVVIMHEGRLVAHGPVSELVGTATTLAVDVDDPDRAMEVLTALPGVGKVSTTAGGLRCALDGTGPAELVRAMVRAGVGVERIAPVHGLEEVFLDLIGASE